MIIGVLVLAPLIAAIGAGPTWTALAWAYSVVLAIVLGFPNHFFGSEDHLVRVLTVVIGGGLGVVIADLRQRREMDSVRLGVQYAVARALTESETLAEAAPRVLEAIGRPLGWEVGGLWEVRQPRVLRCVQSWYAQGVDPGGFEKLSRQYVLRPGFGLPGRVWQTGEPVWIENVVEDENFPRAELAAKAGLRGAVGFPVRTSAGVVGVIEYFAKDIRKPDPELVELMAATGSQVGEFIESGRAAEALRESEARKSAMLESALDCVIVMDQEGRVVEFNPAAERTFGYSQAQVVGREMAQLIIPPDLRERHRQALRRYVDTEESNILGQRLELTGMRADGTEFPVELAIARIGTHSPPAFTGYVRDITERRRAEEERERLLRLEQLARVDATHARDQLEAILRGVADGVTAQAPDGRLVFANDAALRTLGYDSVEELLSAPLEQVMSRFEVFDEEGRPYPLERLPGRRALQGEGEVEDLVRFRIQATGEEQWSVVKATPILDEQGEVVMAINVFEDISEHKRAEREQRFLADSSQVLASSLDPDQTLQQIAQLAVPVIADWCAVDLSRPDGSIEPVALSHADPAQIEWAEELRERYPPDANGPRGVPNVLRTGEPEIYSDIPDELLVEGAVDEEHLRILRGVGFRSAMVVPMASHDHTWGAITFVSGDSGRRFDQADLALAEELARRCATALENARLYSERAYIAKTLQQSLLPAELPTIPGLDTAARFHATGDGNEVGGDFYDLFETGGRGWTVVVGDVCGKGPDAAAITALARYTLRAAAMRERLPSRSLHLLNEALLRQRRDRRFCTVAYAYLEALPEGVRVGFASGGHPLPLVLRGDGEVEWLGTHGTLLGVVPDPEFEDRSAELAPGDALVFYTDGVTEARGSNGALGEDKLAALVASCAGLAADEIASRVEAAALDLQGGRPRDDIAVVVLRVAA